MPVVVLMVVLDCLNKRRSRTHTERERKMLVMVVGGK